VAVADLTVWAARDYADALRSALLGYKERGRSDLAAPLSAYLVAAVRSARSDALPDFPQAGAGPGAPAPAPPVLVPVPSRRSAARARGGDHVLRLARRAAREVGAELARPLWLLGGVRDSAGLGETERARNVSHRMRALAAPPGAGPVLLVDDIVTTGSTLIEASRALRAGGWTVLDAAVVAATRRRRPGTGRPW
jgi:predicted amidophosphoribosyltransferase